MGRVTAGRRIAVFVLAAATIGFIPGSTSRSAEAAMCTVEASVDIVYDDATTGTAVLFKIGPEHVYVNVFPEPQLTPDVRTDIYAMDGSLVGSMTHHVQAVTSDGMVWAYRREPSGSISDQLVLLTATGDVVADLGTTTNTWYVYEVGPFRWVYDIGNGFRVYTSEGQYLRSVPTTPLGWAEHLPDWLKEDPSLFAQIGGQVAVVTRNSTGDWISLYAQDGTWVRDLPPPPGVVDYSTQVFAASKSEIVVKNGREDSPGLHRYTAQGDYIGPIAHPTGAGFDFQGYGNPGATGPVAVNGSSIGWLSGSGLDHGAVIINGGSVEPVAGITEAAGLYAVGDGFHIIEDRGSDSAGTITAVSSTGQVLSASNVLQTHRVGVDGITSVVVSDSYSIPDSSIDLVSSSGTHLGSLALDSIWDAFGDWEFARSGQYVVLHGALRIGSNPLEPDVARLRIFDVSSCVPEGTFADDDGSVFEDDIEWLAEEGITRGCNPPANDLYCPIATVTRAQMATFLDRALDLADTTTDFFGDDDGSVHEAAINRLAASGITKGCNPSEGNTSFCPTGNVTRGQMAAFLVRAMGYTDDGGGDLFDDDDGLIFESSIDKLATAGVTRGCNPSEGNTKFCPHSYVTRAQMAAFLHRALG